MNYLIYFVLGIFFAQFILPLFNTFSGCILAIFETTLNKVTGKKEKEAQRNVIGFQIGNIENTS